MASAAGGAISIGFGIHRGKSFADEGPPLLADTLPPGVRDVASLEALPGKAPLIRLTDRPPNYETPFSYLQGPITPNEAFFVRYHLAGIPEKIDPDAWRLSIGGEGLERPFVLSLSELKGMPAVEVNAVLQCAGARRGLVEPHVLGVQWGVGAMGGAKWRGARLKDLMARAGLRKEAVEIVLDGADGPVIEKTPKFVKSIPVWKALDDNVIIAYEMNGAPLPHWNGFPARVIVPGWAGTYWMKHAISLTAVTKPFTGYWMANAYRIPVRKFAFIEHFTSQENDATTPVTEMMVNSLVTQPTNGGQVAVGAPVEVKGLAWDAGYGVSAVEVSTDGGLTFAEAQLGEDLGRFAFRPFRYLFTPTARSRRVIVVKASNRIGQTQTAQFIANPGGYHNNLVSRIVLDVV